MTDGEKVIKSVDICLGNGHCADCHYCLRRAGITTMDCRKYLLTDILALLKEQDELLRKLQKDKDKLCLEVSEWKHKYHDRPLKEQEEQIKNRDESLEKAREEIKWLRGMLKEQEPLKPKKVKGYNPPMYTIYEYECEKCKSPMMNKQPYCMGCGRSVNWE